jgi:hypothetical protein
MDTFSTIGGLALRHTLTLAAGALIAKGVIGQDQGPELIGLGMTVAAFAWSWLQKHNASKTLASALNGLNK